MSDLECQLLEKDRHLSRLEGDLSSRAEELRNLKKSYDTVSRTLEQTVSSQARLREVLSQSKERERETGLLSDERLAQLQSAETKLFDSQVHTHRHRYRRLC